MKKVKFKEQQRFSRFEIYALLLILILGLSYRFVEKALINGIQMDSYSISVIGSIALLAGVLWYFWQLRLEISINKKGVNYQFGSWAPTQRKIKWKDIKEYHFIETPEAASWAGWNVQFQNEEHQATFCGRNGVQIVTKSGDKFFIGSKNLEAIKAHIKHYLSKK